MYLYLKRKPSEDMSNTMGFGERAAAVTTVRGGQSRTKAMAVARATVRRSRR